MKTSESITKICPAFIKFQSQMKALELTQKVSVKTRSGGTYAFKYAPLDTIREVIKTPLKENGLAYIQAIEEDGAVTTRVIHESGEWIQGTFKLEPFEKSPQAWGSAITYNRRYSLAAILGLVSEQDDDGNRAEGNDYKSGTRKESNGSEKKQPDPPQQKAPEKLTQTGMATALNLIRNNAQTVNKESVSPTRYVDFICKVRSVTKDQEKQLRGAAEEKEKELAEMVE